MHWGIKTVTRKELETYVLKQCQPADFAAYFHEQKRDRLYRQDENGNFIFIPTKTWEQLKEEILKCNSGS